MAITIRQEQDNGSNSTGISFTTTSVIGDTIILFQANDWYNLAHLQTPTGTAVSGGWTLRQTYDNGTNAFHAKIWEGTVTAANGTVIVNSSSTDEERYAACFVLTTGTYDTGANQSSGTATTSFIAPSATAAGADDLMLCMWCNTDEASTPALTPPGGMTAYTQRSVGGFVAYRAASEQLTASGATGTRTCTSASAKSYLGITVLVKSTANQLSLMDTTGFLRVVDPSDSLSIGQVYADATTGLRAVNTFGEVAVNESFLMSGAVGAVRAANTFGESISRGIALADVAPIGVRTANLPGSLTYTLIRSDSAQFLRLGSVFGEVIVRTSSTAGFICQDFSATVSVDAYTGVALVDAYSGEVTVDSYGGIATNCGR